MEESRLTEPEIDAALQLIQLSCDSDSGIRCNNNTAGAGDACAKRPRDDCGGGEESVGDTAEICSSSASASAVNINVITTEDENLDEADQGWLSRKRKFRSVVELYRLTSPMIKASKRSKKANKK